jgi:hypothetical protein
VQRPRAALDLHYLLSFFGDESRLQPQRLLGLATRSLQTTPIVTQDSIEDAKADPTLSLAESDLADSVELVRLTPSALSLEELSKLWSVFFQTPYALSVAYQAGVVLIESEETPSSGLPVRERKLHLVPFNHPRVEQVVSSEGEREPIVSDSVVVVRGHRLRGEVTVVLVAGSEVEPLALGDSELTFDVASVPASALRAGVQGLQVVQKIPFDEPSDLRRVFESNVAPFVLHPRVTPTAATGTQVTLAVEPDLRAGQRVSLLLDEVGVAAPRSHSVTAPTPDADSASIEVPIDGVTPGDYLVRLRVDGAESPLAVDPVEGSPTFGQYVEPSVTIP